MVTSRRREHSRRAARRGNRACANFAAAVLAAAFLCALPAWGQVELNVVGTWGGAVNAVFVDEAANPDIAYIASGRSLVILDVSDPTRPLQLGSIDLGNYVYDVAVRNGYAFAARHSTPDIQVIDVTDPANPAIVWTHDDNTARQIRLRGNAMYVRANNDLDVYDISNPASPVYRGRIMPSIVESISIVDNLLFILHDMWDGSHLRAALKIADLSTNPFSPEIIGEVNLPVLVNDEEPLAIDANGAYAYMTVKTNTPVVAGRLVAIDVSNPRAPFVAGTLDDLFTLPLDIALGDGFAYVADYNGSWEPGRHTSGLRIFDIATNPSAPAPVGNYESHGAVKGVEVVGTRAYVLDEGEGLLILDVSDPSNPVRLGNWHSPSFLRKIDKVGNLLYVTDRWNGFTILDVSDPRHPTPVGVYQTGPDGINNFGIELRDGLAYLAAGHAGIDVVDVSDPAAPARIGGFLFNPCIFSVGLALAGDIAHVGTSTCAGGGSFVNFDISDPQNILDVGFFSIGAPPLTIDTSPAGFAFIASLNFIVADTSDPTNPFFVFGGPQGRDLARDGNLVYLANRERNASAGLYIFDVSEPASPVQLTHFQTRNAFAIAVRNDLAFFTGDEATAGRPKLFALDVSNPAAPALLVMIDLPEGHNGAMLLAGRYIYITTNSSGLVCVEVQGVFTPGDMNCDEVFNGADIDPFFLALGDPAAYQAVFPNCDIMNGDMNNDGRLDGGDIDPFFDCLGGGPCP